MKRQYYLACVALLFASCSRDPNLRKAEFLKSGQAYLDSSKFDEAAIQFRNAIQIDPRSAQAHYLLGRAYFATNRLQAARSELSEAVTLNPASAGAQTEFAAVLTAIGDAEQAKAAAEKAIQLDPKNARPHVIIAQNYAVTGKLPGAIQELEAAIELDSKSVATYTALAALHVSQGRTNEAESINRKAIETNPKSVEARIALAQFYFAQGKWSDAEQPLAAAVELDRHAVLPRLLLGRLYVLTGRLTLAESVYTELKTVAPDDPQAYSSLGRFYLSTGQKDKAIAEFSALVSARPRDNNARLNLVVTLIDLNRTKEAAPLLEQVLSATPGDPQALLANGRLLIAAGKYQEAAASLEKSARAEPRPATYYYLGVAQKSEGLSVLAKASFKRALQMDPRYAEAGAALTALNRMDGNEELPEATVDQPGQASPSSYVALARGLSARGDDAGAEALAQKALALNPKFLPAHAVLLKIDVDRGKTASAAQRLTQLLDQDPSNAGLHFLLGLACFELKDITNSENHVRKAIALDSRIPDTYTLLANIDLAKGLPDKAKEDLRTAIDRNPRNMANYLALILQYKKDRSWEQAKKVCEEARTVDSNSPLVAAELASIYLETGGDVNMAVSLAQTAKQQMPGSPAVSDTLGWAYYKLGSYDMAVEQLHDCLKRAPANQACSYHLGMAYMQSGHSESASRVLRKTLQENPGSPYAAEIRTALDRLNRTP